MATSNISVSGLPNGWEQESILLNGVRVSAHITPDELDRYTVGTEVGSLTTTVPVSYRLPGQELATPPVVTKEPLYIKERTRVRNDLYAIVLWRKS